MVAALVYSFARAMTTVSAVIFLVSAEYEAPTSPLVARLSDEFLLWFDGLRTPDER